MTDLHTDGFTYHEPPWGDLLFGSKQQLQAIGIGVGCAFPGEEGGAVRRLITKDPRGFKCRVEKWTDSQFLASIPFPDREKRPSLFGEWLPYARDVVHRAAGCLDEFEGCAAALVAAGIVPFGYFPGDAGMRKTCVVILPDGSLPQGPRTSPNVSRAVGVKIVERTGKNRFRVGVRVSDEEDAARCEIMKQRDAAWEVRMRALPRPPRIDGPLRAASAQAAAVRRAGLRLVWSKPLFVPQFTLPPPGPFARV